MRAPRDDQFQEFVRRRRPSLLNIATVMTGGDRHSAEDLVQSSLTKMYVAWPRIRPRNLDNYARRALVNVLIDEKRTPYRRREQVREIIPDVAAEVTDAGDKPDVLAALSRLPPGMRAAVVLRHVEGLSTEETAAALRCSTGTVKSQTARALVKLREFLSESDHAYSRDARR